MRMSRFCSRSFWTASAISLPQSSKTLSLPGEGAPAHNITGGRRIEEKPPTRQDVRMTIDSQNLNPLLSHEAGHIVAPGLLHPAQCRGLSALWADDAAFRKHVVMLRHSY